MRPIAPASFRRARQLSTSRFVVENEKQKTQNYFTRFFFAAILHIGLALLLYQFRPNLPTIFVIVVLLIALSRLRDETPVRLVYICTYIASAELLWRMTKAQVFWESGKYLLVLLMILGAIRWRIRLQGLGIVYFILLIPGVIIAFGALDFATAIDEVSFNMSGPLALGVATAFLGGIKLNREQVGNILLIGLLPIISVGTLAARSTLSAERIAFISESNFTTSGGYGPNQISAILSLGALLGMFYLFNARPTGIQWWITIVTSSVLLLQSVLTFSRGGLLNLVFAVPAAMFFFTQNGGKDMRRILILSIVFSALVGWMIPYLNNYTNGALEARYEELDTTGRAELIKADIRTWQENPIFGVGVSLGGKNRGYGLGALYNIDSHTEYSRMLAEHGMFGVIAILMLVFLILGGLRRTRGGLAKGMLAGMMIWSLVEMTHAAMRIAAISYYFALPFVLLNMDDES